MAFIGTPVGGVAARHPVAPRATTAARPAGVTMAAAPLSRRGLLGLAAAAAAAAVVPAVWADEAATATEAASSAASSVSSAASSAATAVAEAPAAAVDAVKAAAPSAPATPAAPATPPAPVATNFTVTGDYKEDAKLMLNNLKATTALTRGTPGMADTVNKTRKQMNDFVALYRRNGKVSGSVSFSTLYTAINTLSGHYASYGAAYPVPEKRKKRLSQQFSEIERAIARGR